MSQASLSFDRAVDYYDRTRSLTPQARTAMTELLRRELDGRGPVLEIGVGTGRIALPLHEAGVELIGIDISEPMLRRLGANAGGRTPFPVARADATALPFRKDSFGAAIASHVLHLIPRWRSVLKNVVDAVRPGGVFLLDHGDWQGVFREIGDRFIDLARLDRSNRGVDRVEDIDAAMRVRGATPRLLPEIVMRKPRSYEQMISSLEDGTWSRTWQASEEVRRAAGAELRRWSEERYGDLSQEIVDETSILWHAFDLP
jgi:SAM-dependent methyltransferase